MSLLRVFLLFVYAHVTNIIRVPPSKATSTVEKGNEFVKSYKSKIVDLNLIGFCQFYHLIAYFDQDVTLFEWMLFTVFIIGTLLRFWSYYELGRYFTFEIQIQDGQKIIKTGPYKYFAHPSYVGQFMLFISSLLFYAIPWYFNLPLIAYVCYRFYHRITEEERMLLKHFGQDYTVYRKSVW